MLQIRQEFNDVARTDLRLMDEWQQYKSRILNLATTKASTAQLLEAIDDMDEGLCLVICWMFHCIFVMLHLLTASVADTR